MPLFFAYCPDRVGDDVLPTRLRVRSEHFQGFKQTVQEGHAEFGRGFRPSTDSHLFAPENLALLPESVEPMAGSVMLLRYDTLEEAWARVRADVYWTARVWDHDRAVLEQFCEPPAAGTVAGVDDAASVGKGKA